MTDEEPNILIGVDGCDLRISITFPNTGEAKAAASFIRDKINTEGSVNIRLGVPGDVVGQA
jgi:hypothetical protein